MIKSFKNRAFADDAVDRRKLGFLKDFNIINFTVVEGLI